MTDKQLFKLALDALEANQPINYCMNNNGEKFPMFSNDPLRQERNEKAITALKERLADPMHEVQRLGQEIEQEPTAKYSDIISDGGLDPRNKFDVSPQRTEPLIGCVNHDCVKCKERNT